MRDGWMADERRTRRARVLVIGGGITGLAAANRILDEHPHVAVTLVERDIRLGGKILTVEADGYCIEAGPDSMLANKPRGVGLSDELGLEDRLIRPIEANRGAFVLRGAKLHPLPEGLTGLVPTRLGPVARSGLISPGGKMRMLRDYVRKASDGQVDESLAAFITRRLGREVYENLIEPLMAGIYAGDGTKLSLAATFPQLRAAEQEHGSLIKGVLAQRARAAAELSGPSRTGFVTFSNGLQELVTALSERVRKAGGEIQTGSAVSLLESARHGYRVTIDGDDGPTVLDVDGVIVATQAWAAAPLVERLDHSVGAALAKIPHVSNAIVALGFDDADGAIAKRLNGYGYVIPRTEDRSVMAMTWLSSKWSGRAPAGKALIRAFVGRDGQQQLLQRPDDDLVELVRREMSEVLGIGNAPELTRVFRWDGGMPQYTLGHLDRVAAITTGAAALPGFAIAGNMLGGVGLPDCILAGERAADKVAAEVSRN